MATRRDGTPYRWQSFPKGLFHPAAQNIEFDFLTSVDDIPLGGSSLRIEGISLEDVQYGQQFGAQLINGQYKDGYDIRVYGGMGKGLPLANPAQQGLILSGTIFQSYGNWQGTDMTLDFVISPAKAFVQPVNLVVQLASEH